MEFLRGGTFLNLFIHRCVLFRFWIEYGNIIDMISIRLVLAPYWACVQFDMLIYSRAYVYTSRIIPYVPRKTVAIETATLSHWKLCHKIALIQPTGEEGIIYTHSEMYSNKKNPTTNTRLRLCGGAQVSVAPVLPLSWISGWKWFIVEGMNTYTHTRQKHQPASACESN